MLKPTGPIDTTLCDFETVESVNDKLYANLHDLVQMPFFKYFQVPGLLRVLAPFLTFPRSTCTENVRSGPTTGRAATRGAQ
jgi:hypothetical protein